MARDRRLRKTEDAIQNAFIKLILDNGYESIKISDLIEEADINKSTFYLHYNSILGVSYAIEDRLISDALETWNLCKGSLEERLDAFFTFLSKDKKKYQAVIAVSDGHLFKKAESSFKPFFERFVTKTNDKEVRAYRISFYFGAVYSSIRKWLISSGRTDRKKLIQLLCEMLETTNKKAN